MQMPQKEIRVSSSYKTQSMLLYTKWKRIKVMSQVKKFLKVLKSLQYPLITKISSKLCLIITESCSDLKISNKYWSKKQKQEVYPFHKYFHLKKRSCTKRLRKWPINTVGLSLYIKASVLKIQVIAIHLCNTSQEFFPIKNMIDSFTRL